MLVLTRNLGSHIYVGDDITITIVDIGRGKVRVGVTAPAEIPVYRDELCEKGTRAPADVNARKAELAANMLPRAEAV